MTDDRPATHEEALDRLAAAELLFIDHGYAFASMFVDWLAESTDEPTRDFVAAYRVLRECIADARGAFDKGLDDMIEDLRADKQFDVWYEDGKMYRRECTEHHDGHDGTSDPHGPVSGEVDA